MWALLEVLEGVTIREGATVRAPIEAVEAETAWTAPMHQVVQQAVQQTVQQTVQQAWKPPRRA